MIKVGKWIVKHKKLILILCLLLFIPSFLGISRTKINYDILSYLPENLETVEGQDILVDEFGMGAFSMVIVEDMDTKDIVSLKEEIEEIPHVKEVLWYDDFLDTTVPMDMLPENLQKIFNQDNATMMVALFDNTTSSDETMEAVSQMRQLCEKQCFISGMSGVVTDIKNLSMSEMPVYVVIAALLCMVVLGLTMESFFTPVLFLFSIGAAIIYNLGSNVISGEISYITQALTAVLQLGVTMDYSIFLLNSYEENKVRFEGDKGRAMAHAISNTFKSVVGSSVTTIAGFIALCFMSFTLGKDIGIVMAKGVVLGVICCVTLLPSLILIFDKVIEKTKHRSFIPNLEKVSDFITKHYLVWIVIFLVMLFPAVYGNNHTEVYYNIDQTLPASLDSSVANKKLEEKFNMNNIYMILLKGDYSSKEKIEMMNKMEEVDGIEWVLGMDSVVGPMVPDMMIPEGIQSSLKNGEYEIQFVCSDYKAATTKMNDQITEINEIVKGYGEDSMVIGEAPLTKDLVDVTDVDFQNVSIASIAAIFVIIMFVFKSVSLPVILVAVIEFAIFINMAIPYYTGTVLPFVASIVVGTIQLGATVDYAILMTSKYQRERGMGKDKKEAISLAHRSSMKSILISGISFFAATFGVGLYSQIDMISSICSLLSRGAIISMLVVICVLPAMLLIFDRLICVTSIGFAKKTERKEK